jgi:hypothetical protein
VVPEADGRGDGPDVNMVVALARKVLIAALDTAAAGKLA